MSAEMIYGRQTEHSIENFPSQGRTLGDLPPFVRNYALVKHAAAIANNKVSRLDDARRDAITTACTEIAAGQYSDQFPSALLHGGGGIATNMNINEVIANRASVLGNVAVHPNDHVNASQSTNETYQAAMALTLLDLVENPLVAMEELASVLDDKAREFRDVQHLGRTCLQDAVTISANLTHRAQAAGVRRPANSLRIAVDQVSEVPIGGTVIGTGIGSSAEFSAICVSELARLSGRKLMAAENFADSVANFDPYGAISGACVRSAIAVGKIASDIRLLASGPRGGFGDIAIPAVQAGSSIMPAKVNPVIPEYAMQLAFRIRGCGHTVDLAVAAGELEINVMEGVILDALTTMFSDLAAAATVLTRKCVQGLTWNGPRRKSNLAGAFDESVNISCVRGYEEATVLRNSTEATAQGAK